MEKVTPLSINGLSCRYAHISVSNQSVIHIHRYTLKDSIDADF